jgi:hypothetical protein
MFSTRIQLSLFALLVFVIIGAPATYDMTDDLIARHLKLDFSDGDGAPTRLGLVVHGLVAGLLTFAYVTTFKM